MHFRLLNFFLVLFKFLETVNALHIINGLNLRHHFLVIADQTRIYGVKFEKVLVRAKMKQQILGAELFLIGTHHEIEELHELRIHFQNGGDGLLVFVTEGEVLQIYRLNVLLDLEIQVSEQILGLGRPGVIN